MEQPLVNIPQTSFAPSFPRIIQPITQPSSSHAPIQPMIIKGSSLLQALQGHPLFNNHNLDANIVLGMLNTIPQDPKHQYVSLSSKTRTYHPLSMPHPPFPLIHKVTPPTSHKGKLIYLDKCVPSMLHIHFHKETYQYHNHTHHSLSWHHHPHQFKV